MQLIIKIEGCETRIVDIEEEAFTIGRSLKNLVCIEYEGISRSHLKLRTSGEVYFITDLGSSNGTFLNGERIEPNTEIPWHTFLPIILGEKVSISFGAVIPGIHSIDIKAPPTERVRSSENKLEKNSSRPGQVQIKASGVNPFIIQGVIILSLAYFFYNYYSDKDYEESSVGQANKEKEKKKSQPLIPVVSPFIDEIKCQDEIANKFCKMVKAAPEIGEGVILKDGNAILYINFSSRIKNAEFDPSFSSEKDKERMLYLMSFLALREDVRTLINREGLKNLFIVDISTGPTKVHQVLKVTKPNLQKLTTVDITTIFSGVQKKRPELFDSLINPLLELEYAN